MMTRFAFNGAAAAAPAVEQLINATDPTASGASLIVHRDDDMLAFSVAIAGAVPLGTMAYFRAGMSIVDTVAQIVSWRFGSLAEVDSFLDFAAGYGRSTRFLVRHIAPERVCVAEIQADALAFQAEQFGVATLRSETDPREVTVDKRYDVVFAASLFTHLPERTFGPWLGKLWEFVAPGGMLIFSTHDEAMNDSGQQLIDGFSFTASTEVAELSTEDYGTNYTSEAFVRGKLEQAIGADSRNAIRLPRALCFQQDVWVVCQGESPSTPLSCECGPTGCVDTLQLRPGSIELIGWAADQGFSDAGLVSHRIASVSILRNGHHAGEATLGYERHDVATVHHREDGPWLASGWQATVATSGLKRDDIVTVLATCEHGARFVLDSTRVHDILDRTHALDTFPLPGTWRTKLGTAKRLAQQGGARAVIGHAIAKLTRLVRRAAGRRRRT